MVSAIDRAKRALIALVKTLAAAYNVVISRRRRRFRYRPPVHVARWRCCWSSFLSVVVVSVVVARRPSSSVAFVVGRRCAKSRRPGECRFVFICGVRRPRLGGR